MGTAAITGAPAENPRLGVVRMLAEMDRVQIDAETGACGWDGTPVQYEWVVDELAYREYRQPS